MLSRREPALWLLVDGSSNLDFHSASFSLNINDDTNNLSVVEVDNIVWLQIPNDVVAVYSEMIWFRWQVIWVAARKLDNGARSNPHCSVLFIAVRDSDLSAPDFQHQTALFMWPKPFRFLEFLNQSEICLKRSMAQIDPGHWHAGIEDFDYLSHFVSFRTIKEKINTNLIFKLTQVYKRSSSFSLYNRFVRIRFPFWSSWIRPSRPTILPRRRIHLPGLLRLQPYSTGCHPLVTRKCHQDR